MVTVAIAALRALVETPHIRSYLEQNDPKALEQALAALTPSPYEWRMVPTGTWIYVNASGADVGHVYQVPGGWWADPWGREKRGFPTAEEAKRWVEEKLK
jgi:hypothetical protein